MDPESRGKVINTSLHLHIDPLSAIDPSTHRPIASSTHRHIDTFTHRHIHMDGIPSSRRVLPLRQGRHLT